MTQTQAQTPVEARVNKLDDYTQVLGMAEVSELRALAARFRGHPRLRFLGGAEK